MSIINRIQERAVGLDVIRISLSLLVLMFHSRICSLHCSYGIFNTFIDCGAIAMTGFFLLSGYVINLTYKGSDMTDIKRIGSFYLKRLISILPVYLVLEILFFVADFVLYGKLDALQNLVLFPVEILGIQSAYSSLFDYLHVDWFISCILICYFIYPLLKILTNDITDKSRIITIVFLFFIILWSPIVQHVFHLQSIYTNPFFRAMEFYVGILLSQLNTTEKPCKLIYFLRKPAICVCTVFWLFAGIFIFRINHISIDYMLYNWVSLPCFATILVSFGNLRPKGIINRSTFIKYLSELSFCLYLAQSINLWKVIQRLFEYGGLESNILKITVSFLAYFGIANILHYFIEVPSSNYLKRKLLQKIELQ